MKANRLVVLVLCTLGPRAVVAADVVRLGNLKFAGYAAVSYMKEIAPRYGLQVEERVFPKGIDILPAIVAGEIDVGASAVDGAIAGRAAGVPIFVVAGLFKRGVRIVGRSDMKWSSVADLKGKKVAVARGGAHELLLLAELDKHHLTYSDRPGKDVQIVYMAYADINQALLGKDIDAMCQSEPHASQAIRKGFGVEIIKPYDTPLGETVRTLVMTERMYQTRRDVAQRFVDCFVEATRHFMDDPAAAERFVRERMFKGQLTSEDYRDAIDNSPFTFDVTVADVQISADLMMKYGVGKMTRPPRAVDFVKLDLLEAAKRRLQPR